MLVTVDCDYLFPEYAASYLLAENGRAAFVENNTAHAVPHLMAALKKVGVRPEHVDYLIITHVHLDHAGGTSALLAQCPNAKVLAHPRAARHLKDPSRLIAGARAVYGDARYEELYGEIGPVPADRIEEMADESEKQWQGHTWRFLHTRGHANHHFVVWDSKVQATFTGDSFGILYPVLQKNGLFIFPSTSPKDFDAAAASDSIERIAALPGDRAFPTHFGELRGRRAAADQLKDWIAFSQALLERARARGGSFDELTAFCLKDIDARFRAELQKRRLDPATHWELLRIDRELNAQGLAVLAVPT